MAASRGVLLERQQSLVERLEGREARRVAAAYRKARQEIVDFLLTHWTGSDVLTPGQASDLLRRMGLLQQIDARLLQLEAELGIGVRNLVNVASETAIEHIRQQLELLPSSVARPGTTFSTINTRMIERFVPVAFQDVTLGTRSLSIALQRELQTGLLQGESFPNLVTRLMAATPGDLGSSTWRNGEVSAERATRRLVITAENAAKNEAMSEARRDGLDIQKQAIAALGPTTTDCCLRVHGQIQPVDKPFRLTGTPRFADEMMHPAFHWNCRTAETMHHPVFEESGLTTASMQKSAQAELRKR